MRYLPTGAQMKQGDQKTITEMGMPSMVLMERAALSVVEMMESEQLDLKKVLVVCGSGDKASETDCGPLWSTCKRTGRRRLLYGDRGCNFWNWIIKTGFRDIL